MSKILSPPYFFKNKPLIAPETHLLTTVGGAAVLLITVSILRADFKPFKNENDYTIGRALFRYIGMKVGGLQDRKQDRKIKKIAEEKRVSVLEEHQNIKKPLHYLTKTQLRKVSPGSLAIQV